jgi:drug/metabolite transporter (DMT)-like permease
MSTSRSAGWHRLASRAAVTGMIVGFTSLAVGVFVMNPIASHSPSDDSPASVATLALAFYGLAVAAASAVLWAGEALRWRACNRH